MARSDFPPFFDRRKGNDRRQDLDPCKDLPVDLYHRKRRKTNERRKAATPEEQYQGYLKSIGAAPPSEDS